MQRFLILLPVLAAYAEAQQTPVVLSNDRLELTVAARGGSMVRLVLKDDPARLSPFGDAARPLGHFVCVDGFGNVSQEERAAGLPGHGEAHTQNWEPAVVSRGRVNAARFTARLPIVQENFTRTVQMVEGENVVYVETELESLLGFDRPVNWGEHPSIAPPFLEPENLVVDVSGRRSKTRVHDDSAPARTLTLAADREFAWPMAPLIAGGTRNIRSAPAGADSVDHTTTLVDPARTHGFVTALNTARGYLLGYLFRREEFPWVQDWQSYPKDMRLYRGLEFATQPFDVPRRETIALNAMFGVPVYRWLPAKSKISARFLMFWVKAPEGFRQVDDVRLENGALVIEDRRTNKRLALAASLGL